MKAQMKLNDPLIEAEGSDPTELFKLLGQAEETFDADSSSAFAGMVDSLPADTGAPTLFDLFDDDAPLRKRDYPD